MRVFLILVLITSCTTQFPDKYDDTGFIEYWSQNPIYFLLVDRFSNGNKKNDYDVDLTKIKSYHGGDFKGLVDNFSYLDDLNVGTILFTPIMDNRNTDFYGHFGLHGYWIIDHYKVDEHFGSMKLFKKFSRLRKRRGKRLIMDIVLNHVDWDHPWYKNNPDWFHTMGSITDWNDPRQLVEGQVSGLPDLNQDKAEVYDELLKHTIFWLKRSMAEGIRLDAVKHIKHSFWKRYIGDIKRYQIEHNQNYNFLFLAEILHGDPNHYKPYLEDGFNAFYDYPMYYTISDVFARSKSIFNLASRLQTEASVFPTNILLTTFIDNHDMPRFLSLSKKVTVEDMRQALFFINMVRGVPMIYYGTEGNLRGKTGEEGRKDLKMGYVPNFDYISKLNLIRKESKSLYKGIREDLIINNNYYVFRKIWKDEESIIVINRGVVEQRISVKIEKNSLFAKEEEVVDLISGELFQIKNSGLEINLSAKRSLMFRLRGNALRYKYLKNLKPEIVDLKLKLQVGKLKKGESIYMIGSSDEIGSWKVENAFGPFRKDENGYYKASLKTTLKKILEYKFIKVDKVKKIVWEEIPNRFYFVDAKNGVLELVWNK